MAEKEIGKVFIYYGKIGVAAIELSDDLKIGDKIRIKGATTDFEQVVESMQVEHQNVEVANKGSQVGMKVADKVKEGDVVFKIS